MRSRTPSPHTNNSELYSTAKMPKFEQDMLHSVSLMRRMWQPVSIQDADRRSQFLGISFRLKTESFCDIGGTLLIERGIVATKVDTGMESLVSKTAAFTSLLTIEKPTAGVSQGPFRFFNGFGNVLKMTST